MKKPSTPRTLPREYQKLTREMNGPSRTAVQRAAKQRASRLHSNMMNRAINTVDKAYDAYQEARSKLHDAFIDNIGRLSKGKKSAVKPIKVSSSLVALSDAAARLAALVEIDEMQLARKQVK